MSGNDTDNGKKFFLLSEDGLFGFIMAYLLAYYEHVKLVPCTWLSACIFFVGFGLIAFLSLLIPLLHAARRLFTSYTTVGFAGMLNFANALAVAHLLIIPTCIMILKSTITIPESIDPITDYGEYIAVVMISYTFREAQKLVDDSEHGTEYNIFVPLLTGAIIGMATGQYFCYRERETALNTYVFGGAILIFGSFIRGSGQNRARIRWEGNTLPRVVASFLTVISGIWLSNQNLIVGWKKRIPGK